MILYPYQIISTSNVGSTNLKHLFQVTFVAISEVVNLVHERDPFLELGHDCMDDVHLFAVVDTGVRSKRLKDRKRSTHNPTI